MRSEVMNIAKYLQHLKKRLIIDAVILTLKGNIRGTVNCDLLTSTLNLPN